MQWAPWVGLRSGGWVDVDLQGQRVLPMPEGGGGLEGWVWEGSIVFL